MPHLRHYDNLGTARFITFSCYRRRPLFASDAEYAIMIDELRCARQTHGFFLLGYVIMPNHVHLVIHPQNILEMGRVIGEIKSKTARRISEYLRQEAKHNRVMASVERDGIKHFVFWQKRCYDHNCRTAEYVKEKINYCHMNPVRAGLVAEMAAWPWSSYRWYNGYSDAVLDIDGMEV